MLLKQSQSGLSAFGLLFFMFVGGVVFSVCVKLFPSYSDNITVKSVLEDVIENPTELAKPRSEIRRNIERRLSINQVSLPNRDALEILRDENGLVFVLDYEERVSLFANVDAVVVFKDEFKATQP